MNRETENILSTCLEQLEQGDTIDAILRRNPGESEELRPYLETASHVSQLASLPTIATQQKSQALFLSQAAALRSPQASPIPFWQPLRRMLMPMASLVVVILLLGFSLVTISAAALPGDGLYPVKRTVENLRMMRASDPEQILNLSAQFQQERLQEITLLLRAGRDADVIFEGDIEAIDSTNWVISGLTVQLDSSTFIDGSPRVGELARVDGHTSAGLLFARQISILTGDPDPEEIPTIELTETPKPTPTEPVKAQSVRPILAASATATPTATPTATVTPTATPTDPQITPEVIPTEPVASPPPATSPPVNGDVDNDNSDDGDNDNSGDGDNDNSGDGDNDNSGDDENDNSGDGDNDNSGDGDNDNSGDDENDNSGDDENDNSGDDENDNSGDDENDNSGDDENDNSGDDENDNSGDDGQNDDK